ncbi:MAG: hypothetical protein ACKVX9_15975 [Blastocatellia bacterium]
MTTRADQQAGVMRRYLLGELPESEQIALEERFFADHELVERMREIEHELVDGYVRERLPRAERELFERHYLTTPDHRESVAFARELLRAADEENEEPDARPAREEGSFREKVLALFRAPQFALGAAAALVVALLIGGVWLSGRRARWEQELAQSRAARDAEQQRARGLEDQLARQRAENARLNEEFDRLRAARRLASEPSAAASPRQSVFSFALVSFARGSSEQQTLELPPGATRVQLRMKIERGDHRRYQVLLHPLDRSSESGDDWRSGAVKASPRADGATLSVNVPAARLPRGDYILTLTGTGAGGAAEEINRYFFRVNR